MASLTISHLRLHLVPEQPLHVPAHNKGNTLRGGFGAAFRRLVCVDRSWECAECTLRYTCPYTKVFNPFIPPDASQFSGNRDIPRPFVFKPPLSEQTCYAVGQPLRFDLVLIGQAITHLPYFIVAFRELGATGFGLNRAPARLARVEAVAGDSTATEVYDSAHNLVRPPPAMRLPIFSTEHAPIGLESCNTPHVGEQRMMAPGEELTLRFLTPTALKAGSVPGQPGMVVRQPAFHHVVKRLRDRVSALAAFHGDRPLDADFKAMGAAAEEVTTTHHDIHWIERSRVSRRKDVHHDLSGFVGTLTFRGHVSPFLPLLRLGEYIHVGKNAVFGNGWFEIANVSTGARS